MPYARRSSAAVRAVRPAAPASPAVKPSQKQKAKSIWQMEIGGGSQKTDMTAVEVLLFTSELADLIDAGMTLGAALKALASQGEEKSAQHFIAQDLCDRIVRGETFSDACAAHPKTFQPLYVNMIRAGEASGALVEVMRRLVEHYERYDNMRAKIKSAMTYPIVVLVFGIFAVIGALVWIIPKFEKVFKTLKGTLPLPTRMLIAASDFFVHYGVFIAIAAVLGWLWFRKWKTTPSGRRRIDGWKLRAPLIANIVATGTYSSLAYTLKTLLLNGVNVLQALKISADTCGNAVIEDALNEARKRVTDGTTISGPLAASGVFPRLMTDMLAVGEQAGDMPSSLEHIGKRYQKDMDRAITSFTNALEPLMIVFIAGAVGFVAIAILMAVFELSNQIGK